MPCCLENCGSKSTDCDRAPSSTEAGTTRVPSGSGANAKEGNGVNGADPSLAPEERLEKWKSGINLDTLTDNQLVIHNCHRKAVEVFVLQKIIWIFSR